VLVRPEAALKQLEEEEKERQRKQRERETAVVSSTVGDDSDRKGVTDRNNGSSGVILSTFDPNPTPVPVQKLRRFHGTIEVEPRRMASEAQQILNEVVQHLAGLVGAQVTVSIDISAYIPDGVPDDVILTVTENCRTLKFKSSGFEVE
jgi:hypothetical protein